MHTEKPVHNRGMSLLRECKTKRLSKGHVNGSTYQVINQHILFLSGHLVHHLFNFHMGMAYIWNQIL